jgi:hypothetical protein
MGKYAPLKAFLLAQDRDQVPMTFAEIEQVLQFPLPRSKRYPAWWSNNASNNTMTREWLEAGFETESVDVAREKLVFRRVSGQRAMRVGPGFEETGPPAYTARRRHPLFGCMKGLLTLSPGVDLTEPADPGLADHLDRKYGLEARREQ